MIQISYKFINIFNLIWTQFIRLVVENFDKLYIKKKKNTKEKNNSLKVINNKILALENS